MGWLTVLKFVVLFIVSWLIRPKTSSQESPEPGTVESGAVAEEGTEIPVLFGTRDVTGLNVVWYGDTRVVPVKKKSGGKK